MTFADRVINFNKSLVAPSVPAGVEVMNPFQNKLTFELSSRFYKKYYHDTNKRVGILGINPGRFGAGLTGIPFTDPKKLESICGIENSFPKKAELSGDFIYMMIDQFGGPEKFYSKFFFNSVCPLGFIRDGKNMNYYDTKPLQNAVTPYIIKALRTEIEIGLETSVVYCLGEGKNYEFLSKLNEKHHFFESIIPLSHPRYIMQYKRKFLKEYIGEFVEKLLNSC
jgi:hypothetical protein